MTDICQWISKSINSVKAQSVLLNPQCMTFNFVKAVCNLLLTFLWFSHLIWQSWQLVGDSGREIWKDGERPGSVQFMCSKITQMIQPNTHLSPKQPRCRSFISEKKKIRKWTSLQNGVSGPFPAFHFSVCVTYSSLHNNKMCRKTVKLVGWWGSFKKWQIYRKGRNKSTEEKGKSPV